MTCPFPVLALPVVERNRKRQDPILSRRTGAQVKGSLLHMLPEVNPLPDVKDLRFNIASSHDLFIRGPAKLKIDTLMPKLVQVAGFII